jgi:pseudomonalisin
MRISPGLLLLTAFPLAAAGAPGPRQAIREGDRVVLARSVPAAAADAFELGPAAPDVPMQRMILSLKLRPGARAELRRFLRRHQDPNSPDFGSFLTPEEFGRRFGVPDEELNGVTGWLQRHGFVVEEIGKGRTWIDFSGTAGQVEEAFGTSIREYAVDGRLHRANAVPVSLPRGIAELSNGPVSLNDFHSRPMLVRPPLAGDGFGHVALAPADLWTIYDVKPLLDGGTTGGGTSIAIVGRSDINLADVRDFRARFGLPENDPVFIHNGPDPGNLLLDEELEGALDVEWSGAMAPNATVNFVVSQSTATTDGVDLSSQYIVDQNLSPVMSVSFGQCERNVGDAENAFYGALWAQAAAQGISVFVASGDSGAAGCAPSFFDTATDAVGVNALASTPDDTAVGGSQFLSGSSLYWTSSPDPTTQATALSYVPEQAWNESGNASGGFGLIATGGGRSRVYPKPDWQTGSGVKDDGTRDLPDVSLSAAVLHAPYLTVVDGLVQPVGGTSASSPAMAGIMALIVQKTGSRQGNANPTLYRLGSNQYDNNGTTVFHDIALGDNWVPGQTGFSGKPGYDMATGLGSVDASALANAWEGAGGAAAPAPGPASPGNSGGP